MPIQQIIHFFVTYKYLSIFPIAVVEGPIITIISGFLVSIGLLDLLPALITVYFADIVSDLIYHHTGKWGRDVIQYLKFFRVSDEKFVEIENRFKLSPWRTMIIAKISYGLGTVFMIASGASRMSVKKFIKYIFSLNLIRSSFLLFIGYYFGKIAVSLGPSYIKYYSIVVIILVPSVYMILRKKKTP